MEGIDKWAMLQNHTIYIRKHIMWCSNTLVCFSILNLQTNVSIYHFLELPSELDYFFLHLFSLIQILISQPPKHAQLWSYRALESREQHSR